MGVLNHVHDWAQTQFGTKCQNCSAAITHLNIATNIANTPKNKLTSVADIANDIFVRVFGGSGSG